MFFRTGDNCLGKNIGGKLDVRQIFVQKTGRASKKYLVDGRQKNIWWTGDPKSRPSFYTGGGGVQPKQSVYPFFF